MLLEEVNVRHSGTYDFFYLPIDFKNRCNVGYCFINFIDPKFIPAFIEEFVGQRWKSFNSEKVCTITYARIQGKNAMISRFQNSSLLDKDDEYKPLLFYSTGPDAGKPEPFPASTRAPNGVATNNSNNNGASPAAGKSFSPNGANNAVTTNMMYMPIPPPGIHSPNQAMNIPAQYPPHHHHHHQQQQQMQVPQNMAMSMQHQFMNHPNGFHPQQVQYMHNGIPPAPGLTVIHEESVSPTSFASPASTNTSAATPNNATVTA